jgi:hypothetical protein
VCGSTGIVDVVPVVIDGYMALLSTRSGSRAAALCAAYGGAKDRKRMMKVSSAIQLYCLCYCIVRNRYYVYVCVYIAAATSAILVL